MSKMGFRDLKVWQESKKLAVDVYKKTNSGEFKRDYGLKDQVRRSAVSVCSNIAESDERNSLGDSTRFFRIAKGSIAELITQLEFAEDVGHINKATSEKLVVNYNQIARMLGSLIQARKSLI